MDERQVSIVFQSSLKIATEVVSHNSGGEPVSMKRIIALAWKLTKLASEPLKYKDYLEGLVKELDELEKDGK